MSEEIAKVDCRLTSRGTHKADACALDDLTIPDPDSATGKKVIQEAIEKGKKEDVESEDS